MAGVIGSLEIALEFGFDGRGQNQVLGLEVDGEIALCVGDEELVLFAIFFPDVLERFDGNFPLIVIDSEGKLVEENAVMVTISEILLVSAQLHVHIFVIYPPVYRNHVFRYVGRSLLQLLVYFVLLQFRPKRDQSIPQPPLLLPLERYVLQLQRHFVVILLLDEEEGLDEEALPPFEGVTLKAAGLEGSFEGLVLFFDFFPLPFADFVGGIEEEFGAVEGGEGEFVGDVVDFDGHEVGDV